MGRGKSRVEQNWYNDAKYLFVYGHYTYQELATKFPVAEKTLRNWAQRDGWLQEKNEWLKEKMQLSTEVTHIAITELRAIRELRQKDPMTEISQSRYYAAKSFADLAAKLYDYDQKVRVDDKVDDKSGKDKDGKLSEETLKMIENDLKMV